MAYLETQTAEHLLPMIYEGLVCLARKRLAYYGTREYSHPAELVHEAYLRVVTNKQASFEGRRHLFFVISRTMRDLLIEGVRRNAAGKRGGGFLNVELEAMDITVEPHPKELLDLGRALQKLTQDSPASAQVVVLSYFVGLTHPEIAQLLSLSRATIERRWRYARSWLRQELAGTEREGIRRRNSA